MCHLATDIGSVEQVLGLNVAVCNVQAVAVRQCVGNLPHDHARFGLGE